MLQTIERTIVNHDLFGPATPVVLMVSGGSDSTALAYLMTELHERGQVGPLAMLHVNHKLRGEQSEADQRFVEQLAAGLDIPLFTCEIDIAMLVAETGANMEAVARNERYLAAHEALESMCRHEAVPIAHARIVTAHTADDRVENFYMRSIVGTGPGGFRSMLYRNGPVVRPLMDVSRDALRGYLLERAQDGGLFTARDEAGACWREDATNAHTDKFRAYVRHEIIPLAKKRNPRLLETLGRTMNLIADEDDFLDGLASEAYEAHLVWSGDGMEYGESPAECLVKPEFAEVPVVIQRRVALALLQQFLGTDARVETAAVEAVLAAFADGAPVSGYTANIQGDLAVSANKSGARIEPMAAFRARRKPDRN